MSDHTHGAISRRLCSHGSFSGRTSRIYDVAARRFLRRVYRRIAEDIALVAPASGAVLDVGTGPGVLLAEIARARTDLQARGVDLSPDMVTAALKNVAEFGARVTVRPGDVVELPFDDAAFDIVVTTFSMHHWSDIDAAIPEILRVLKPGGKCFVYDFDRAPFDAVDTATQNNETPTARRFEHRSINLGGLHLRRCIRHAIVINA